MGGACTSTRRCSCHARGGLYDDGAEEQINAERPYFFLPSCPEELLVEAKDLVDRYGGFCCVSEEDNEEYEAWKGKAVGQFMTLKQLSPPGRRVIGIAIAGFSHCNDEREFLRQLTLRKDCEQFELKQCGDVTDVERWIQCEGYRALRGATAFAALESHRSIHSKGSRSKSPATETGGTQTIAGSPARGTAPKNPLWDSMNALMSGNSAKETARRERLLLDVEQAMAETGSVGTTNARSLQEALTKLSTALQDASSAGVAPQELRRAEARHLELQKFIDEEQAKGSIRGFCSSCICCCRGGEPRQQGAADEFPVDGVKADSTLLGFEFGADKANDKQAAGFATRLPSTLDSDPILEPGTKCCYSSAKQGLMTAVVKAFNTSDGTYDLDVRPHARPENIFPAGDVPLCRAWPEGILVEYESRSAKHWVAGVIRSYNPGTAHEAGTYNLDVREHASVDRIRLR